MSKAVLVMDMPSSCNKCEFCLEITENHHCCQRVSDDNDMCKRIDYDVEFYQYEKPDWCPLRELPEKKKYGETLKIAIENDCYDGTTEDKAYFDGYDKGYNACIDELLKGEK